MHITFCAAELLLLKTEIWVNIISIYEWYKNTSLEALKTFLHLLHLFFEGFPF